MTSAPGLPCYATTTSLIGWWSSWWMMKVKSRPSYCAHLLWTKSKMTSVANKETGKANLSYPNIAKHWKLLGPGFIVVYDFPQSSLGNVIRYIYWSNEIKKMYVAKLTINNWFYRVMDTIRKVIDLAVKRAYCYDEAIFTNLLFYLLYKSGVIFLYV